MATTRNLRTRGRPPLPWLPPTAVRALPPGTAVVLELDGHRPRLRGRVAGRVGDELTVESYGGRHVTVTGAELTRGRVVDSLYDPADDVLLVGTPQHAWRGGVVRTEGRSVLVEQSTGPAFAWRDERELERPQDQMLNTPAVRQPA